MEAVAFAEKMAPSPESAELPKTLEEQYVWVLSRTEGNQVSKPACAREQSGEERNRAIHCFDLPPRLISAESEFQVQMQVLQSRI
jgi:hypothetical protein